MKLTGQTPAHLVGIGITPYETTTAASAEAPHEPQAPQGSLRCDGVVGLRVESAEALSLTWQEVAASYEKIAEGKDDYNRGWYDGMAYAYRQRANWLQGICRQAGYSIPRQPEPNHLR